MRDLLQYLPVVADFPRPGIAFRDICPLLADAAAFDQALASMEELVQHWQVDRIAGIESRGLIFAAALAARMHLGLVPIRKPGKLPPQTLRENYALEYGQDGLEVQHAAFQAADQVLLVDDVIATGGTLLAAARLVQRLGARVAGVVSVLEIRALDGRARLEAAGLEVRTVLRD